MAVETAFRSLDNLGVAADHTLLVHGAGTTVGFAAVQIARMRGARVVATAGETFANRLRALGAEVTPYSDGMVDRVREVAGGAPDLVLDTAPVSGALPDLIAIAGGDPRRVLTISDFEAAARLGARDSYADLEPYYDELEAFLGVSGPSPYPWGPPRRAAYPLAPLPANGAAQLMARACDTLGIRTSPAPNAALSAPYYQRGVGWRAACTNRGFCQAGCSTGAKASMDVTFIPLAEEAGAEVRAECYVTGFERDRAGRLTAVVYVEGGPDGEGTAGVERRQRCRAVFLCAGAVETPRLLLLHGLATASGQVGRHFMAHTGIQFWGRFDEDVRPYKGIPGALISEDTHRPADADFAGGYLLQSIGAMPVTYASQLARGRGLWGDALRAHMRGYNRTAGINILGDCLPHDGNCVELSDEADGRGLPKPRVTFTAGENELRMHAHAERVMRQVWAAAGARDAWAFPRFAHTIGTCRMGTDPSAAVVDPDGRAFDVPNLYISDNSTFPSALAVNPALTIMAVALRTADRFLASAARREA